LADHLRKLERRGPSKLAAGRVGRRGKLIDRAEEDRALRLGSRTYRTKRDHMYAAAGRQFLTALPAAVDLRKSCPPVL